MIPAHAVIFDKIFQSTLPARGATCVFNRFRGYIRISIHAPRTGSDKQSCNSRDHVTSFQSTLPARGATGSHQRPPAAGDFNPRSPHGERHQRPHQPPEGRRFQSTLPARGATNIFQVFEPGEEISIHAPRTGSDLSSVRNKESKFVFQSTLPARGATGLS